MASFAKFNSSWSFYRMRLATEMWNFNKKCMKFFEKFTIVLLISFQINNCISYIHVTLQQITNKLLWRIIYLSWKMASKMSEWNQILEYILHRLPIFRNCACLSICVMLKTIKKKLSIQVRESRCERRSQNYQLFSQFMKMAWEKMTVFSESVL